MADSSEGFEVFGERALHTRRKRLQNKIEDRAEGDKAAVRREKICWQYMLYILKCELIINIHIYIYTDAPLPQPPLRRLAGQLNVVPAW